MDGDEERIEAQADYLRKHTYDLSRGERIALLQAEALLRLAAAAERLADILQKPKTE